MKEITVEELKAKKDAGENFFLLDVREGWEYMVSNINGVHIPLGELQNRLRELEDQRDADFIVMCRSGGRSSRATAFLTSQGFSNVHNLKGGITAWSKEIDPSIPVA